jgi:hypothetical protein
MLIRVYVLVRVCVCVCVTDHDSKNLYSVLVNLDNVTYEAASIQSCSSSLGPGSKNGVKPWVELNIINNNTFFCFDWSDLHELYARLNLLCYFTEFGWVLFLSKYNELLVTIKNCVIRINGTVVVVENASSFCFTSVNKYALLLLHTN